MTKDRLRDLSGSHYLSKPPEKRDPTDENQDWYIQQQAWTWPETGVNIRRLQRAVVLNIFTPVMWYY